MDNADPAALLAGTTTTIALPGPLPAVPHAAHPIVLPQQSGKSNCHATPHRYFQDSIEVIPADTVTTGNHTEGKLFTESASDGQTAFYTHL